MKRAIRFLVDWALCAGAFYVGNLHGGFGWAVGGALAMGVLLIFADWRYHRGWMDGFTQAEVDVYGRRLT